MCVCVWFSVLGVFVFFVFKHPKCKDLLLNSVGLPS